MFGKPFYHHIKPFYLSTNHCTIISHYSTILPTIPPTYSIIPFYTATSTVIPTYQTILPLYQPFYHHIIPFYITIQYHPLYHCTIINHSSTLSAILPSY
jgi:hypothetical protein